MTTSTATTLRQLDETGSGIDGLPFGAGLNIAYEAVDRHVERGRGAHVALRCISRRGDQDDVSYAELQDRTNRFASALDGLGVGAGERIVLILDRTSDLYVAALGTWKHRSVVCPLFPVFGPEPVRQRIAIASGRVLVTTPTLYHRRVAPVRAQLPSLEHILLVGANAEEVAAVPGGHDLRSLLDDASPACGIGPTEPEDLATLHFTSGTTGTPKAAMHVHAAVASHHLTGTVALGLREDDVFWCTADPGWVTGTSYGIISPLTHGATVIVDEGDFDVDRWYALLAHQHVTVWYTAPTALRMLRRAGSSAAAPYDLSALRLVASVGEPLDADTVVWTDEVWHRPVHDGWWQTETGGIMIANVAGQPVVPGSMGRPLPGVNATVLARDEAHDGDPLLMDGHVAAVADGVEGHLALRPGWPSMFRGYLGEQARYEACFVDGWYITGDLVRRDRDGAYWFVGRADDVIKTAGHLVGPSEVERVLRAHPAVAEAGVIGAPHPVAGTIIKAFVTLQPGSDPSEALRRELIGFARSKLGPAIAPRAIEFIATMPLTRSGKIMRRVLRARELGEPEGDLSTLETGPETNPVDTGTESTTKGDR